MSRPTFSSKRKGKKTDPYPIGAERPSPSSQTKRSGRGRPRKPKSETSSLTLSETKELVKTNLLLIESLAQGEFEQGLRIARKSGVINFFGPYMGRRKGEYRQGVYIPDPPKGWESLGLVHSHPWESYAEFSDEDMKDLETHKHQLDIVTGHTGGEILLNRDQWLFFNFRGDGVRTEAEM